MKEEKASVEVILVERNNIKVEDKRRTEENVVSPSPRSPPSDPLLQIVVQEREETRERAVGPFQQFYRKNFKESSRSLCMNKWAVILEQHLEYMRGIYITAYKLSGYVGITIFKIIFGISAIIFFSFEYNKNIKHMNAYLLFAISSTLSYMISSIILNTARYGKKSKYPQTTFEITSTCWGYMNMCFIFYSINLILVKVILHDLWTINYYISLISLFLMILTDSFALGGVLPLPIYFLFFLELLIFGLIMCMRNICCRKRIIPGIDFAPELHLKEHQQLLVKGDIAQGTSCPICLGELMVGQHVVFMPCGKLHIFHRSCIKAWLIGNSICPTCRAEFVYIDNASEVSAVSNIPAHNLDAMSNIDSDSQRPLNIIHQVNDIHRHNFDSTIRSVGVKYRKSNTINGYYCYQEKCIHFKLI